MRRRHPARDFTVPTLWLMTDERQGDALTRALARLPRGSGIVFRHHATPEPERAALLTAVARTARLRGLVLGVELQSRSGPAVQVIRSLRGRAPADVWLARVHTAREARQARSYAVAAFVSPVFATRTHPGAQPLGLMRSVALATIAGIPAIALGGMTPRRFRLLQKLGFHGWAAIDALTRFAQKRKAVPI